MAQGAWHGLRGPADYLIPDNTRELVYSGAASSVTSAAAYVLNSREVTRTISRMAAHHVTNVYAANPGSVYPRSALRTVAQRQTVKGSFLRGAGFFLRAAPGIGWAVTAVSLAYSLPGSKPGSLGHEARVENVRRAFAHPKGPQYD